jgi:MFS family permease
MSTPARAAPGYGAALVAPLALGSVLNPINSSMIATALAPIGGALNAAASQTVWLVASLYVASAVAQPTMGRLADRWGARRVFLLGLVVVLLAGIAGGFAKSLGMLVGVRVLIGIGTSAAYPSAMRVLRTHARRVGRETPRSVLAVLSLAAQSSMAVGPTLGGLLIGAWGWRAIFVVNVPLAAIGIILCLRLVERDDRSDVEADGPPFDIVGMTLFASTISALMFFLMDLKKTPHWLLVPVTAALLALLVAHSARRALAQPFLDFRMLAANKALASTYLRFGVTCILAYAVLYGFAQWLESALGYSPIEAGVATLPLSIAAMATSLLVGRTKTLRAPLAFAAVALLVGCGGLLALGDHSSHFAVGVVGAIFGVAQGTASVANQAAVYEQAPAAEVGTSAGLQRTAGYLGAVVASSLLGLFYGHQATTGGMHSLAFTMMALSVVLGVGTLADPSLSPTKKPQLAN